MQTQQRVHRLGLLAIVALILGSLWLAYDGAARTSATYDEPVHLAASKVYVQSFDLSVNPEHPPLWKLLVGLSIGDELMVRTDTPLFKKLPETPRAEWQWAATELFRKGGFGTFEGALWRGRGVTMGWGLALLTLVGWMGWRWGGAWGASLAVAMVGFDPTFLAHTAVVTNDVPFAVTALVFAIALARWARKPTLLSAAVVGVIVAIGMLTKFSAVGYLPMGLGVGAVVVARSSRRGAVAGGIALAVLIAWAGVWAGYGFRDPRLPMSPELADIAAVHGGQAPVSARATAWCGEHHVIPSPLARGLLTQYRIAQRSRAFVMGENRNPAPWYSLPLSWMFKTPVGLMALVVVGIGLWASRGTGVWPEVGGSRSMGGTPMLREAGVLAFCAGVFLVLAIVSGRGRGVRYLLPMLPLAYLLASAHLARLLRGVKGRIAVGALVALFGVEVALAGGRYLSYFNVPSRALGEPWALLGDSNLDWGQGLTELAGWRRANAGEKVYLAYFGTADPHAYGVEDIRESAPPFLLRPNDARVPEKGSLLAISATILQGTYLTEEQRALYEPYRCKKPIAVLSGGSILVFRVERSP